MERTIRTLQDVPEIGSVVIALVRVPVSAVLPVITWLDPGRVLVTASQPDRWQALRAALDRAPSGSELVLVHEPNRPLSTIGSIRELLKRASARTGEAVVSTVPVHSSVKRVVDGAVVATVPRDVLHTLQGPWVFRTTDLMRWLQIATEATQPPADELELIAASGGLLRAAPGHRLDVRVTCAADAKFVELALGQHGALAAAKPTASA